MPMKIAIVGLGLMGGSLAMALPGFRDAEVYGVNRSPKPLEEAMAGGWLTGASMDAGDILPKADLVILCLNPGLTMEFMDKHSQSFKPGSVVSDVGGVKRAIVDHALRVLPQGVDFVGGHPMAGREQGGWVSATHKLFQGAHYVLTPHAGNRPESVELLKDLAYHIGCRDVTVTDPDTHDRMIAYTSQLMHVLAAAIVENPDLIPSKGFEGGSFRDATRIATLNAPMWSELFTMNHVALLQAMDCLTDSLRLYRDRIAAGDREGLQAAMEKATECKEAWKRA